MKIKFRRILALVMTVMLVVTTIIFTAGNTLKAEGEDPAAAAPPVTEQKAEPGTEPEPAEPVTDKQELAVEDSNASVNDEEAVKMPAQSFSETAGNGIKVSVSAPEGAFPEGTTITVSAVSRAKAMSLVEGTVENAEDAKGVDITFHYKGKEIQPEKNISVKLGNARVKGDDFSVYHVDGGAVEKVTENANSNGATFKTDKFSIYVLVGESGEETFLKTYSFVDEEGEPLSDPQEVKTGDTLYEPEIPSEVDGKTFIGWYNGDTKFTGFGVQTVEDSDAVTLTAKYSDEEHVVFFVSKGIIVKTQNAKKGEVIDLNNVDIPHAANEGVSAWYNNADLSGTPITSVEMDNSDITVYAEVTAGHWITYDSDGGSIVASKFYTASENTVAPADPKKMGYTFAGWYEGNTKYNFGSPIESDVTLKARWTAAQTKYTVVIWKQSVNDDKNLSNDQKTYDFEDSEVRNALARSTVAPSNADKNKNFAGFTYNLEKSQSVEVKGDGSTILNIYYDRKVVDINFYKYNSGWFNAGWYKWDTFTGLYGQKLSKYNYVWPADNAWHVQPTTNSTRTTFLDGFTNTENIDYYGFDNNGTILISHYTQDINGNYAEIAANNVYAKRGTFNFTNKYDGFQVAEYRLNNKNGSWGEWKPIPTGQNPRVSFEYGLEVRHERNSYDFSYYNYNDVVKKETTKYETPLSGYKDYVPTRPSGISEDFTFEGWYKDKSCTVKYNFNTTMPAGGVVVYANWQAPKYDVIVHTTVNDKTSPAETIPVPYGKKLGDVPAFQALELNGGSIDDVVWMIKKGSSWNVYNMNAGVYGSMELYPVKYEAGKTYKVTYDLNGGTGTVPDDSNLYSAGNSAKVKGIDNATNPDGKYFLGWTTNAEGASDVYYKNSLITIESSNITLFAKWGGKPKTTTLTYKTNYPDGAVDSDGDTLNDDSKDFDKKNNEQVEVLSFEDAELGFKTPRGYKFNGWKANDKTYQPGANIRVDTINEENNILTAQWEKEMQTVKYTVKHKVDGTVQEDDTQDYTDEVWVNADKKELKIQKNSLDPKTTEAYKGYKLGSITIDKDVEGEVEEGALVPDGAVITLNYVQEMQTVKYTVKHKVDGTVQEDDTQDYTDEVWVNADKKELKIQKNSLDPKTTEAYKGYKLGSITIDKDVEGEVKEGALVPDGSTITLNYVQEMQTVKYTVKHKVDGTVQEDDTQDYTDEVWVNADKKELKIQKNSLDPKTTEAYKGYKLGSITIDKDVEGEVEEGALVPDGSIITLNYVQEMQTVKYTVKHKVDGTVQEDDTQDYTDEVWVNADKKELKIQKNSLDPKTTEAYKGYKLGSITIDKDVEGEVEEGALVPDGSIITLNYVQEMQTVKYTVKHKVDGTVQEDDTQDYTDEVWVNADKKELKIQKNSLDPKTTEAYKGYKLGSITIDKDVEGEVEEGALVPDGSTITLNYVQEMQTVKYTVKHKVDGTVQEDDTQDYTDEVWVNADKKELKIQKNSLDPKTTEAYKGYKLGSITIDKDVEGELKEGALVPDGAVITLNYVQEMQTVKYTVKHKVDGTVQEDDTQDYTDEVWVNADKKELKIQKNSLDPKTTEAYKGYKLGSITIDKDVEGELKEGALVPDGAVITLNYVQEMQTVKYTVKHKVDGTVQEDDTQDYTDEVWVNADKKELKIQKNSLDPKTTEAYKGYKLGSITIDKDVEGELKEGALVPDGSTITLNYVKDKEDIILPKTVKYTVEYYEDGVLVDTYTKEEPSWSNEPDEIKVKEKIEIPDKPGFERITRDEDIPKEGTILKNGTVIKIDYISLKFSLTIHYVDERGNTLADDYKGEFKYKEMFDTIYSPVIKGYTPNIASVKCDKEGMPLRDLEFNVVYTRNAELEPAPVPAPGNNDGTGGAAAVLTANPDGTYSLTEIGEHKIPLADNLLDEHCCILHFLIMLAALLMLLWYTYDMKKRQRRILELEATLRGDSAE